MLHSQPRTIIVLGTVLIWSSMAVPTGLKSATVNWQDQVAEQEKKDRIPESCPVTRPPVPPFVPPAPYPNDTSKYAFWIGTNRLWTYLPVSGTWKHLPHYTPDDPSFRQKMLWWVPGYDWRTEHVPKFTLTGRRLDGESPPLHTDQPSHGWTDDSHRPFIVVAFNFPALGCWELKGRYQDAEVKFVVWVER